MTTADLQASTTPVLAAQFRSQTEDDRPRWAAPAQRGLQVAPESQYGMSSSGTGLAV
jgi:hypothetical protein